MDSNKSKLLRDLSNAYPNFLKRDLSKFIKIFFNEIQNALRKGERVELRDSIGVFSVKIQAARESRNPKTQEKVQTPEKKVIRYKMSKKLKLILNNNE